MGLARLSFRTSANLVQAEIRTWSEPTLIRAMTHISVLRERLNDRHTDVQRFRRGGPGRTDATADRGGDPSTRSRDRAMAAGALLGDRERATAACGRRSGAARHRSVPDGLRTPVGRS